MLDKWYGIMPNSILFNKELGDKEKLLFCFISSLCAEKWFCRAGNEYIAEKMWTSERTVREHIWRLAKHGCITLVVEKGNQRKITIWTVAESCHGDGENLPPSDGENLPHNIIRLNIIKEKKIQNLLENLKKLGLEQEIIDKAIEYDSVKPGTKLRDYKNIESWVKELKRCWLESKEWMIKVLEKSIANLYQWITPIKQWEIEKKETSQLRIWDVDPIDWHTITKYDMPNSMYEWDYEKKIYKVKTIYLH